MGGGKSAECEWGELLMPIDYLVTDTELSGIADAIRAKGGASASISFPNGFTTAIAAIPTGITPTGTKQISITQNGTVTEDVANYANAEIAVNVSGGGGATTVSFDDNCMFAGEYISYIDGNGDYQHATYLATMSAVSYQMLSKSLLVYANIIDPEMSGAIVGTPVGMTLVDTKTINVQRNTVYLRFYQVD